MLREPYTGIVEFDEGELGPVEGEEQIGLVGAADEPPVGPGDSDREVAAAHRVE
ncbi:hypothetical protein [Streptomyces sp. NPDC016172]|uniref:hypothetical protein n=1 Tax=Streptomyces sp. NPDC016172 TaxID=3364964 RepID=UPI0036FF92D9